MRTDAAILPVEIDMPPERNPSAATAVVFDVLSATPAAAPLFSSNLTRRAVSFVCGICLPRASLRTPFQ